MHAISPLNQRSPSEAAAMRQALIQFREGVLLQRHPTACREGGLLRRAMIDEFVTWWPGSPTEFYGLCDLAKIKATDPAQIRSSLGDVLAIVAGFGGLSF